MIVQTGAVAALSILMPVVSGCSHQVGPVFDLGPFVISLMICYVSCYDLILLLSLSSQVCGLNPQVLIGEGLTNHEYGERETTVHVKPWHNREAYEFHYVVFTLFCR